MIAEIRYPFHLLLLFLLLSSGLATHSKAAVEVAEVTREAYVTVLQESAAGSSVGVRVLGQSLRETGTKKNYVVICNKDTTSAATIELLSADGWIIKFTQDITDFHGTQLQQAGYRSPTHNTFSLPLKKLTAWRMTEYHKLAFIEPDFVVAENIDCIFDCGSFCASYKFSDGSFDTGVMVIKPSELTYKDMLEKFSSSKWMTEDSFINEYYSKLIYASMLNWSSQGEHGNSGLARLPANLNADATNYYIYNSRWVIANDKLNVNIIRLSAFGFVQME